MPCLKTTGFLNSEPPTPALGAQKAATILFLPGHPVELRCLRNLHPFVHLKSWEPMKEESFMMEMCCDEYLVSKKKKGKKKHLIKSFCKEILLIAKKQRWVSAVCACSRDA